MWACLTREERVDMLAYYEVKRRKMEEARKVQEDADWAKKHEGKGAQVDGHRSRALVKALRAQGATEETIKAFLDSGEDKGMSRR